ncbi:flp pilus-assembly TadE/G-like family protein [Micrococcales bacterium 31B]|nr:flp pilus-assembly TadE/G-like family protein [Micrococcales bacterium 31B]
MSANRPAHLRRWRAERGSAAALTLCSAVLLMLLVPIAISVIIAYRAHSRADGIADLAAIAAAQAVQARDPEPCAAALTVARLNASHLGTCDVRANDSVLVTVTEPLPPIAGLALGTVEGRALAGPASLAVTP